MAASFVPCPAHLIPSFRVWHFPLAGPHVSWVVFHGRVDDPVSGAPRMRRLVWNRDADLERLELGRRRKPVLEPALSTDETEIDSVRLSSLMEEVSGLTLPRDRLVLPYLTDQGMEFGLEGFDVEGRDGRPIVRLEWGPLPAQGFEAVARWTLRVRQWLGQVLPYPHNP